MIVCRSSRFTIAAFLTAVAVCGIDGIISVSTGQSAFAAEPAIKAEPLVQAEPQVQAEPSGKPEVGIKAEPLPMPADKPNGQATGAAPAAEPPVQAESVKRDDFVVEVDKLEEIDPESVGVLDDRDGGFGTGMWKGTGRPLAMRLVPLIPAGIRSPVLRDLARRLLLSRAAAPVGKSGDKSLLSLRVDRLQALGDVHGAIRLLQAGASESLDTNLALVEVENRFIDNDNAGACQRAKDVAGQVEGDYWQKAMAYCLALTGEHEQAVMMSDIMRERGTKEDVVYFKLLDGLGGTGETVLDSMPNPQGLLLSMARAASINLPADIVGADNLAILRTAAFSPNADLNLRLAVIERLLNAGAIRAKDVAEIYSGAEFDPPEMENPLVAAEQGWNARTRALLVHAASRITAPRGRVAMLRSAWKLGRKKGEYTTLLHASASVLLSFSATDDMVDVAEDVGYALFATGHTKEGLAWFELARKHAAKNPKAAQAVTMLTPLAHLADAGGALEWDAARLDAWWQATHKARPETAVPTATAVYGLLNAVGKTVPAAVWATLVGRTGGAAVERQLDPALLGALREASNGKRSAETVLYILIAIGAEGLDTAGPQTIATVVKALKSVGFEREAHWLALEAAIAAGA